MSALEFDNVSFGYDQQPVVTDVNLTVAENELLGLIGPNGGGKSTLIKLAAGLLKPEKGRVRVFGRSPSAARQHIGYVPQFAGFERDFPITVTQAVQLGRLGSGRLRWNQADRAAAAQAMAETRLENLRDRPISDLSGGELQRVLIARALAGEPRLLLLDEPTSNLDQRAEEDILHLLTSLSRRMAVILVTHDVGFVAEGVSRVACINRTLVCHDTRGLTGDAIEALYGHSVRLVNHDHDHGPSPGAGHGDNAPPR